jgi:D-3-phosphoglycerate dehydrogenase
MSIDERLINEAQNLQIIGRLGSGMELIDTAYCDTKNIKYFSSPEGNANAVAEMALGLLLAMQRNITRSHTQVKNNQWLRNENRGNELSTLKVGIIGYGNTGSAFAAKLAALGVSVIVHDKYKKITANNPLIQQHSLNYLQQNANVISIHLPLTPETENYADTFFFNTINKNTDIINTSRGKVIQLDALLNAISEGIVSKAALDVLENENIAQLSPQQQVQFLSLCQNNNIILTPHIAGYTHEADIKMAQILLQKMFG